MLKKHMFAPKGAQKMVHKGKGSQQAPLPDRGQINQLSRPPGGSMNDYAKTTPMAQPSPLNDMEGGF